MSSLVIISLPPLRLYYLELISIDISAFYIINTSLAPSPTANITGFSNKYF